MIERARFEAVERDPLFLPDPHYVRLTTLGFNNFVGDLLWFHTIDYFGKEFGRKGEFRSFGHMCDLVTTLDPGAQHVYEFCGSLLSWMAKKPGQAQSILSRGIQNYPDYWRLYYLRGFNAWYFLEDNEAAVQDFSIAARKPDAPVFVASLASRMMVHRDDPTGAVAFLKDLIRDTPPGSIKKALKEKLKHAHLSRHLYFIRLAAAEFERRYQRKPIDLQELVAVGLLEKVFREPFGGSYILDPASGEFKNTSGEKGLEFRGKTAKTGVLRHEFQNLSTTR